MDDFRTLRQLIVGWLLLLVALIPMNAQNGNVLGQVIRLPKSKGNIYQLLGLVTERSGYLFIYDSKIIDNEQTTSIKGEIIRYKKLYTLLPVIKIWRSVR